MKNLYLTLLAVLIAIVTNGQTISGTFTVCEGATRTLTGVPTGSSWSVSDSTVATVSSLGVVTGIAAGTTYISYGGTVAIMTVNPNPAMIMGTPFLCAGDSTILTCATLGGTWLSSNVSIATIGSGTGIVTGGPVWGSATITYTLLITGCFTTKIVSVNPSPGAITGPGTLCVGDTIDLTIAPGGPIMPATWSLSGPGIATFAFSSSIGLVGLSPGVVPVTYTLTGPWGGCSSTKDFTVNPAPAVPAVITGPATICEGLTGTMSCTTGGGTWSSSNVAMATISAGGVVTAVAAGTTKIIYTVPSTGCSARRSLTVNVAPAAITGSSSVCEGLTTTMACATGGGSWSTASGTGMVVIGSSTGIVTGVTAGTATIYYTIGTGCSATKSVTVNATPAPIPGTPTTCVGSTTTLSATPSGGAWGGGSSGVATIGSATGIVTGIGAGTAVFTYSAPAGCFVTVLFTVNPTPAITGTTGICLGTTTTLSSGISGGAWSSSSSTITVDAAGVVSATAAGTATITYALPTSCYSTVIATATATPTVSVSSSLAACGPLYTAVASGATTYSWAPATGITYGATTAFIYPTASTVTYTVTGITAGCSGITSFTLSGNRILGHLSFGGAAPSGTDARVWLIQYNPVDSSIMAQDSLLTCLDNGNPYYEFDGKPAGDYLVKAKLTSSVAGTSDYMPTYGGSAATWDVATPITHTTGSDSLHIAMIYGTVPSGPGFISGYVFMGAGKGTATDVPVANMIIYLKNTTGQVLAYTYTDASGAYMFSAIAAGNYVIWPEEMSYYTISYPITVSAGIPADNIGFKKLTSTGVIVPWSLPTAITTSQEERLSVYPNPATDVITVENAKGTSVTIYDMVGQKVMSTTVISNRLDIDIRQLASGIYVVEARGERFKIIKAER